MPNYRGIAAELAWLGFLVSAVAGGGTWVIIHTWETTRNTLQTMLAAMLYVAVVALFCTHFRARRSARRPHYLPVHIRYPGSTAV